MNISTDIKTPRKSVINKISIYSNSSVLQDSVKTSLLEIFAALRVSSVQPISQNEDWVHL